MTEVKSLFLNINLYDNKTKKIIKFNKYNKNISVLENVKFKLENELQKYDITKEKRLNFKNEMSNLDTFIYMNMKYLAAALVWIDNNNNIIDLKNLQKGNKITDNILELCSIHIPPNISDYEELLIYISKIQSYRNYKYE